MTVYLHAGIADESSLLSPFCHATQVSYLPLFVSLLASVFEDNDLAVCEAVMTVLLTWCRGWQVISGWLAGLTCISSQNTAVLFPLSSHLL